VVHGAVDTRRIVLTGSIVLALGLLALVVLAPPPPQ